jgi:hypothetical protein
MKESSRNITMTIKPISILLLILSLAGTASAISEDLNSDIHIIYTLDENDSLDVLMQFVYINNLNHTLPLFEKRDARLQVFTSSGNSSYGHDVYFVPSRYHFVRIDDGEFYGTYSLSESIVPSLYNSDEFIHNLDFEIFCPGEVLPHKSMTTFNILFSINDSVSTFGEQKALHIARTNIQSHDNYELRVNLPNHPYFWTEFVSSNINPSNILPNGNGQTLVWEKKPEHDIFVTYKITKDPIREDIDNLAEETNQLSKDIDRSGDISLFLGVLALVLALYTFLKAEWGWIKGKFDWVKGKIIIK